MQRFILALLLAILLAVPAIAQEKADTTVNWFTMSHVLYVADGRNHGDLWYDYGVGRRTGLKLGNADIYILGRNIEVEDEGSSLGLSVLIIEPIYPWLDLMLEVGAGNRMVLDEENGDRDYGVISGAALNLHKPNGVGNLFVGAKFYQDTPGEFDAIGVGGGAALQIDDVISTALDLATTGVGLVKAGLELLK